MSDHAKAPDTAWSVPTRYTVVLIALAGVVWFLIYARALVGSLVISALLAYIMSPVVKGLRRVTKLNHQWSVTIVYLLFAATVLVIPSILTPTLLPRVQDLTVQIAELNEQIEVGLQGIANYFGFTLPENFLAGSTSQFIALDDVFGIISDVTANLTWVLITFVVTFYLLRDWEQLREWTIRQAPPSRQAEVRRLYVEIRNVWTAYVRGQLVLMIIVGLASGIGAAILGIRAAWALGLLAGILDAIPNVGPLLATVVAVVVAYLEGSTTMPVAPVVAAGLVLALFGVVQVLENIWLRPRIMGGRLRMHPAIVFVGVLGSLALTGVLLTLIIVPVLGTIGVITRYAHARILGLDPWRNRPGVVAERDSESADTTAAPAEGNDLADPTP